MLFYNLGIHFYGLAIELAKFFNAKAGKWIEGRKNWKKQLTMAKGLKNSIWFHISSLGEYEQAEPLLKLLKERNEKILITFFSPSGFEKKKENPYAEHVFYLPLDSPTNAKDFVYLTKPKAAIFVKYDFWLNHIKALQAQEIPSFVISFIYHEKQWYFKKWLPYLSILKRMDGFYVQNDKTKEKLLAHGFKNVLLTGDTRIDNLNMDPESLNNEVTAISKLLTDAPCIMGGSVYLKECEFISELLQSHKLKVNIVLAPHILNEDYLSKIAEYFAEARMWSELKQNRAHELQQVIIVDQIGLLKELYNIADLVVVGGGFEKAIHNTLEPAAKAKPILFGPKYHKFPEAEAMIKRCGAASFSNYQEFERSFFSLWQNRMAAGERNLAYINENEGASQLVFEDLNERFSFIQERS